MQVVILAGGLGTRLQPLTYDIPKPMIPINGKPYLEYQINYLCKQGFNDIVILISHLGEQIIQYFGNGEYFGVNIQYSIEEIPQGTGGGLKKAELLLAEDFLLIYGDSFLPVEYKDLVEVYKKAKAKALMCVYDNQEDTDVISNIGVNAIGKVVKYLKNVLDQDLKYVDAGVLILNKSILNYIPSSVVFSLENNIFPMLIAEGNVQAYITDKRFYDIGTPDRLALAKEILG